MAQKSQIINLQDFVCQSQFFTSRYWGTSVFKKCETPQGDTIFQSLVRGTLGKVCILLLSIETRLVRRKSVLEIEARAQIELKTSG